MIESINQRGFKLLAIRPLKYTSSELLKGLRENCFYKFYNDFTYDLDENDKVISIKHNSNLPSDLYGINISISAIVGKNGSGKSSLLEIFYCFLFSYSRIEGLLRIDDELIKTGNMDLYFEFYYLLGNEISCVEWDPVNNFVQTSFRYNSENQTYEKDNDSQSFNNGNALPFYNIVTNYSIYGLNSNSDKDRWLDSLFIKNDGYQTPIVLNPYREKGNIDVNREFELANARLLKVFLSTPSESKDFNTSTLISNVSVNKLLFKLDIDKNLNIHINGKKIDLKSVIKDFEHINEYEIKDFFNSLTEKFKKQIEFRDLKFSFNKLEFLQEATLVGNCIDLSNLYIFKKIVKIVYNYKNYNVFKPIFENKNIGNLISNSNLNNRFVQQYYKYFLTNSENLNQNEIIENSKKMYNFDYNKLEDIKKTLLKYYYNFYDESFINNVYANSNIKITEKLSVYDSINNFLNDFNILLTHKEIRYELISSLLDKLSDDNSHITLKLRQVLNMQESNFFENLEVRSEKNLFVTDSMNLVYYTVKNEYLSKSKTLVIEEIPNAFFEPIFIFNKKNANKSFELKYLSSGEQQLLHSTISIAYHIDNLLSVVYNERERGRENSNLKSYKVINIILDEIELYCHPEYQREYIKHLIVLLSQEKYSDLSFNVILSTHSPFILSDIPSQNVLKLKDGKPENVDSINSFAANIYDLLKDEFFLKNGAIGAFAQNFINGLIEEIDNVKQDDSKEIIGSLKKKIEIIGEELIRYNLEDLLIEKTQSVNEEITILEQRLNQLKLNAKGNEKSQDRI